MPTKKLSELLTECVIPQALDREISGLTLDSRQVKAGDLFFAYKGVHLDGREYVEDAILRGASAIVIESNLEANDSYSLQKNIPIFSVPNLHQKIGNIAAIFFNYPADLLKIVGITGTNGKTSCSHFIAAALQKLQIACGVVGTLGNGLYGQIKPGNLTTPDAITLQALFADFLRHNAHTVAMEVSSHSIDQGRVNDIPFEVGIFTNLTRDHLDYHGDMQNYGAVKKRLFDNVLLQHAVINLDDSFGASLIADLSITKDIYAYSVRKPNASVGVPTIFAEAVELDISGLHARVHTPWGEGDLHVNLIGEFNLSNLLAVLTTLCLLKIPFTDALKVLSSLESVPGRMQTLGGEDKPLVVVDYAHTPDALEKVLIALRQHCVGQLYCIFGCGGDRDKGKRPIMAAIAEQYADHVVVTNDNPRHESPEEIVKDILVGFTSPETILIQHDRSKAIQDIIQCAKTGDCILIAGKGAEAFQQVGNVKIPFSDVEKARQFLS